MGVPYRTDPSARASLDDDGAETMNTTSDDVAVLGVIFSLGIILAGSGLGAGAAGVTSAAIGMIMAVFALSSFVRDVLRAAPRA